VVRSSFVFVEKISESGTTTVYKAHQTVLDRTVLLKVLHKHLLRDSDLVSRFSREAKACAILQCENIVQVYDLTEIDGAPAIVMEYVEGQSLEEILLGGIYSEDLMMRVASSVLNALSYAHEKGVVHRDIKPGNILVSRSGVIKVTDFGLAAVSDAPSLTMEGSLIGTPAYMSPEQAKGEVVDRRTDLFSLGITLIETLTGEQILLGKSYAECIGKIQSFRLQSIERFAERFSPSLLEFMKRLLAPNRDERFSSAEEALNFLNSFAGKGEWTAEIARRSGEKKKRTRLILATFGFVLLLGFLLSLVIVNSAKRKIETVGPGVVDTSANTKARAETSERGNKNEAAPSFFLKRRAVRNEASGLPSTPVSNEVRDLTASTVEDSGYISITCNPWAEVDIDSEYVGRTPIAGSIKVPVGKHTLTFSNPIFELIVKEINVLPKNLSAVEADFLKDAGYVSVTVSPWGDIYIDGMKRETTPLSKPIIVSAGFRRIRIHNPAFQDIIENLKVIAGDTTRLSFTFQTSDVK
jgi:serine/threonine protein kinase